ncbi:MAG: leucine-rich repeat protein [Oscillospiraceae bacterium]
MKIKKFISLLTSLMLSASLCTGLAKAENVPFTYSKNGEDSVIINSYTGTDKEIIIPEKIDGATVTEISHHAFENNENIEKISIPSGVTKIGHLAFCSQSLAEIEVADGNSTFTSIDGVLFDKSVQTLLLYPPCKQDLNYSVPDTVTQFAENAFSGCENLESVKIPETITAISSSAFSDCKNLKSINIPETVTNIGFFAFGGCKKLENIKFPDSLLYIGEGAVYDTAWYNSQEDGVVYIGVIAYSYKGKMPYNSEITLKDGTTVISEHAFEMEENLAKITLPDSVRIISEHAFDSTGIEEIEIPKGVTVISAAAFKECANLKKVILPDTITKIEAESFFYCDELTEIEIPRSTKEISDYAFEYCSNLTIKGYRNTEAERYANAKGIKFEALYQNMDINSDGKTDVLDVALMRAAIVGNTDLSEAEFAIADINGDGKINILDVTFLRLEIVNG